MSKHDSKGKSEGSRMQFELEEELAKAKADLTTSLERNSERGNWFGLRMSLKRLPSGLRHPKF